MVGDWTGCEEDVVCVLVCVGVSIAAVIRLDVIVGAIAVLR